MAPMPDLCLCADLGRRTLPELLPWTDTLLATLWAQTGMVPALGLAESPGLAVLASRTVPRGIAALVPVRLAAAFLAPHPIRLLPITPTLLARMRQFGLQRIGQVAAMPRDAMQAQFGQAGTHLWALAHGHDPTPLIPDPILPQLALRRAFAEPLADLSMLAQALTGMAYKLAARLDADGWSVGALQLTLVLADDPPQTSTRTVHPASANPSRLAAILLGMLHSDPPIGPVIAVRVLAHQLATTQIGQLTLFSTSSNPRVVRAALIGQLGDTARMQLRNAMIIDPQARCLEHQAQITAEAMPQQEAR
jgi:hypothetical protein